MKIDIAHVQGIRRVRDRLKLTNIRIINLVIMNFAKNICFQKKNVCMSFKKCITIYLKR